MTIHTTIGHLTPVPPFDFSKSLDFLGYFKPTQGEQTTSSDSLAKAVYIHQQLVVFRLIQAGAVEVPGLHYTLYSEQPIDNNIEAATIDRMRFFLSLDDDLRPFYQIGREDSHFAPIVQELYGYHQVKFLTPFECACWAVLVQRNPMSVAQSMKQRLTETYGGKITLEGKTYWAFPDATRLADAGESEVQAVVRNTRKVEYLLAVIKAFNAVDEHFLRTGDYQEVMAWLHSIRGFGAWSASFVMVRGLGRMERLPIDEKKVLEAASRLYGHTLSQQEIANIAEQYGPYKGQWAHYVRVGS